MTIKSEENKSLLLRTLVTFLDKIDLEKFKREQIEKISSVLCTIFAIVSYLMCFFIILSIFEYKEYNDGIVSQYVFALGSIILILAVLYLKYLIMQAGEDYEKRQKERANYSAKHDINFNANAQNLTVKEVDTILNSHFYSESSLYERQSSIKLDGFLDGVYYTFNYLLKNKGSNFEWPYSPIIKQRKCHFEENESFVKQIMDYGIRQLEEADKRNSKK